MGSAPDCAIEDYQWTGWTCLRFQPSGPWKASLGFQTPHPCLTHLFECAVQLLHLYIQSIQFIHRGTKSSLLPHNQSQRPEPRTCVGRSLSCLEQGHPAGASGYKPGCRKLWLDLDQGKLSANQPDESVWYLWTNSSYVMRGLGKCPFSRQCSRFWTNVAKCALTFFFDKQASDWWRCFQCSFVLCLCFLPEYHGMWFQNVPNGYSYCIHLHTVYSQFLGKKRDVML